MKCQSIVIVLLGLLSGIRLQADHRGELKRTLKPGMPITFQVVKEIAERFENADRTFINSLQGSHHDHITQDATELLHTAEDFRVEFSRWQNCERKEVKDYFDKVNHSQEHLEAIVEELMISKNNVVDWRYKFNWSGVRFRYNEFKFAVTQFCKLRVGNQKDDPTHEH